MSEQEVFRTTLMGGYDKDDVMERLRNIKENSIQEKNKLLKEITTKEKKIDELALRLEKKDAQMVKLEEDINGKYQKYVDHYESITRLLVESQIKADTIVAEAKKKSEQILRITEDEVNRKIDSVQGEIDARIADGKQKYAAVQEEFNEIVKLINEAQKRFMTSYKEVHQIVNRMPDSLKGIEDEPLDVSPEAVSVDDILTRVKYGLEFLKEDSLDDPDEDEFEDISGLLRKYNEE